MLVTVKGLCAQLPRAQMVSLLVLLFALSAPPLRGQTAGTILGQVSDPSGAAVARALVGVENLGTGLLREAKTNEEGRYLILALPIGTYRMTVTAPGFKRFSQTGVQVEVAQNARVDVRLELGPVTESISVSAVALGVDTHSTTIGKTVDSRRLLEMPLNGRNVLQLATLLPGIAVANFPTVVPDARTGPTANVSGSRATDNSVMLDGTVFMSTMYNGSQNLPSPDSVEEFRVLTNTFSAEYGKAAGGVFLAVTKSGTNQPHGTAWEFLRNDALNARNFFASSKPFLRQNQFGASLGGPVILPGYDGRNRTFLFGSYQGIQIREQTLITSFPPSAAERQGDFSGSAKPIIDPLTGQPFPRNIIPAQRFDPMAINILSTYIPTPNQPDGRSLTLRGTPTAGYQVTLKGDHKISASNSLTVRFYRDLETNKNSAGADAESLAGNRWNLVRSWSVADTHIFRPTLLNEFRASYTRVHRVRLRSAANKTPRELGGRFDQEGTLPVVPNLAVTGRFTVNTMNNETEPSDLFQYDDKLSWNRGAHSVKLGAQIMRLRHLSRADFLASGDWSFDGSFTGNAMADYIIGKPVSFSQRTLRESALRAGMYHWFVQDDFRIYRTLTLTLGLRYELNTPYVHVHDRYGIIRPGQQSRLFPTAPPGLVYPGDPGVARGITKTDKNNLAPRVGFAWDLFGTGRVAIRGAYGIFYTTPGASIGSEWLSMAPPYSLVVSIASPPSFSDPYAGRRNPFPYTVDRNKPIFMYPFQGSMMSSDFRDGQVQQFNLNVEQQFGKDFVAAAGYFGRLGVHLPALQEANAARYGPGATLGNVQQRRPFSPDYYSSIYSFQSDSNSNSHGLQVSFNKRFSHGYTVQLAYTFSKSLDTRSDYRAIVGGAQDPANVRGGEYGLSDFDRRHVLVVNGVWEIPVFRGGSLLNRALGGWQLSGITRISSGPPFTVLSGRDTALVGSGLNVSKERPNVIGDARLNPDRARSELINRYFNTTAFALPAPGLYGNSGRNNLIGPVSAGSDLGLQKRFYFSKERRGRFTFRAEIFNLFNQVNFAVPNSTFTASAFGRILSAADARIVQFGIRYDF